MKNIAKYRVHQAYKLLREAMPIMIFIMMLFFGAAIIGFQKDNKEILKGIAGTSQNTETIVQKQDETLQAIKDTAEDNRLNDEQKANLIICMLQVPVNERTDDVRESCRKQSKRTTVQYGPTTPAEGSDTITTTKQPNPPQREQPEEPQEPGQPDNEGVILDLPLLPKVHIPSPL